MEIKVGEYGRTNLGNIFIFAWIEYEKGKIDKRKVLIGNGKKFTNNFYYFKENEKIIKHSKNLIDLVEVRRLRKWNIGNRKRKHVIIYRIKRNR